MVCGEKIPKGEFRVVVEREVDTGTFTAKRPGYLHPNCAAEYLDADPEEVADAVTTNSIQLDEATREALLELF